MTALIPAQRTPEQQLLDNAVRLLEQLGIDRVMVAALTARDADCRQCGGGGGERSEARCAVGERLVQCAAAGTDLLPGYGQR